MRHYKLNFRNRPLAEQLAHCEQHLQNLSPLPAEQRPNVDLAQWQDAIAAARTSFDRVAQLRLALKTEITRRNQLLRVARAKTEQAVGHVAVQANLQPHAMVAVGLELEAPKSPVGVPGGVTDIQGEPHSEEGKVRLRWKRPLRRTTFMIQVRAENETEWRLFETSVATKTILEGLTSGVKYWFRVCALNAHGKGAWSNPVAVRVK
jgi:hypothetical protein